MFSFLVGTLIDTGGSKNGFKRGPHVLEHTGVSTLHERIVTAEIALEVVI